ncbi:DNA-binding protein [Mycobacterium sp. E3298]|nr:HU family DNA-binding protein [Mycobacterium sp. E3298]OBG93875.1 DNA-binding protein [Mycobacterium sp. E3298]
MNKPDLIKEISTKTGLDKKQVDAATTALFEIVVEVLQNGEKVQLQGVGTFEAKETAAREGRNPQTGEPVAIPAGKKPTFKFADSVKKSFK